MCLPSMQNKNKQVNKVTKVKLLSVFKFYAYLVMLNREKLNGWDY